MSDRERAKSGEYVETVTPDRVFDAVATHPDPTVTAREVGEAIGCSTDAARKKLNKLNERGGVERKKVGGRSIVWWLTDEQRARGGPADPLFGLAGLFDDDEAAARARERSEEWGEAFDDQLRNGVDDASADEA
ncbi:transcriptional regulator [Halococcus sp. PRR34]|uniref:transcriptional regulator n=1 Tax=Halococcus sp. PRR34 TaxID=3020830 RepID=UPI00235F2534|nr:transcriptional regulator [Halococcus sp. PRR34]